MPISTVSQKGLDAPLSLTTPNLGTPAAVNLTNATSLPNTALPAGTVLQVVQVNNATSPHISTTSTAAVSSGITVTITPKRSNSLIRVDFLSSMALGAGGTMNSRFYKDGSPYGGQYNAGFVSTNVYAPAGGTVWIAPGSTAAITWAIYFYTSAGGTAYLVHIEGSYSLTATEYAV